MGPMRSLIFRAPLSAASTSPKHTSMAVLLVPGSSPPAHQHAWILSRALAQRCQPVSLCRWRVSTDQGRHTACQA